MKNIRQFENFHITLWLIKDMSWLMGWKVLGIFMIAPTLAFAAFITWKEKRSMSDFFHNLAVIFWISANSFWMVSEFLNQEELRIFSAIFFAIGFVFVATYYALAALNIRLAKLFNN